MTPITSAVEPKARVILFAMLTWLIACAHDERPAVRTAATPAPAGSVATPAAAGSAATPAPAGSAATPAPDGAEPLEPPPAAVVHADPKARARAVCTRVAAEFRDLGETTVFDRHHHRGELLTEFQAWCDVWVRPPGSDHEVCFLRIFETVAAAEAYAERLRQPWAGGPPLAAKLTGGTFSFRRSDGLEVFWCGAGKLVPRLVQRGKAFIDGTP